MIKKKILYVHQSAGGGGASTSLFYLINYIKMKERFEPIVVFGQPGPFEVSLRKKKVKCYIRRIPSIGVNSHMPKIYLSWLIFWIFSFVPSVIGIFRIIKREKIDLIHINSSVLITCSIAAHIARVRIIWHVREIIPDTWLGKGQKKIIERFAFKIVAISNEVQKQFSRKKTILIYNGIDPKKFSPDSDRRIISDKYGLKEEEKIFLHLGQLIPAKGSFVFLRAAKLLLDLGYNVRFLIVGGSLREKNRNSQKDYKRKKFGYINTKLKFIKSSKHILKELEVYAKKLDIKEQAIFTGFQPHSKIPNFIDLSDAVVVPHIVPEPFGRVLIEPAALKKPVISSNIPPTTEIVLNGITGILVEPNNPVVLAEAMKYIIENPSEAKRMGEKGYQNVIKNFHIDKTHTKIFEMYKCILN